MMQLVLIVLTKQKALSQNVSNNLTHVSVPIEDGS
jgi:hypothetical protein